MSWEQFRDLLPVLTLALGYFGTHFTQSRSDARTQAREREAAHQAFQRETLLTLQDAVISLFEGLQSVAREERSKSELLVDRLRLHTLSVRVDDQEVRRHVYGIFTVAGKLAEALTPEGEDVEGLGAELAEVQYKATDRIGQLLRGEA